MNTQRLRSSITWIVGVSFFLLSATASVAASIDVPNGEDVYPLPGSDWVIVSSMLGGTQKFGGLYSVEISTGEARKIYPADSPVEPDSENCGSPPSPSLFAPHGIHLQASDNGGFLLYVVNHGGREAVEIFKVIESPGPDLQWVDY